MKLALLLIFPLFKYGFVTPEVDGINACPLNLTFIYITGSIYLYRCIYLKTLFTFSSGVYLLCGLRRRFRLGEFRQYSGCVPGAITEARLCDGLHSAKSYH